MMKIAYAAVALAAMFGVTPAHSTTCLNEVGGRNFGCTAGDVRLGEVDEATITIEEDKCLTDGTITFTADFTVVLTAKERFDIGIWFATDGDENGDAARSGECDAYKLDKGSLDDGDDCGDINMPTTVQTLTITTECVDNGEGLLLLPYCTTWKQPGGNTVCNSADGTIPGSPSKCLCDPGFTVPIQITPCDLCFEYNPATAACEPSDAETPCDDGFACTSFTGAPGGDDACDGMGNCIGDTVTCNDPMNQCKEAKCTEPSGCAVTNLPDATPCDDELACTSFTGAPGGGDACSGGTCLGTTVVCDDPMNQCKEAKCTEPSGCAVTNLPAGESCDDGFVCTSFDEMPGKGDQCDGMGNCDGKPVMCPEPMNQCKVAVCTEASGCLNADKADGTQCNDGNGCSENDVCTGGVCGGIGVVCGCSSTGDNTFSCEQVN